MTRDAAEPSPPADADARRAVVPVICYPTDRLPVPGQDQIDRLRAGMSLLETIVVPPRDGRVVRVRRGQLFRVRCMEGAQVGDLNLWNAEDPTERFYSGKTRALHGAHVGVGARMWSGFPSLRPLATITRDTLDWYGVDGFGAGVHDVIGTRCDPYTHALLEGGVYDRCCHSNLTRALAQATGLSLREAEPLVHDVLNVFMCTGFTEDEHLYFMKASPARKGDYLEFFAEIDLLVGLSTCPGGDCGAEHSSDAAVCHPLAIDILDLPPDSARDWPVVAPSAYPRTHGT